MSEDGQKMSVGVGLHTDIDAIFSLLLFEKLLLRGKPDEIIILPSGQMYEHANRFNKFYHFDTGGIYDPDKGFFDHHLLSKSHPQAGKCAAILTMDYIETQIGKQSAEHRTLAQFAQAIDREKWRGWADKYSLYQDPVSAPILNKLPEIVGQANRSKDVLKKNIIVTVDTIVEAYLEKRRESKEFKKWYRENKKKGVVRIEEAVFGPDVIEEALVVSDCPYDGGDFRHLINHYDNMHPLIIACYAPIGEQRRRRYGVNKPDSLTGLDLQQKYKILCEKFKKSHNLDLADDNNKLFLHNNGLFMYLNQIPPGFTFEEFAKIILTS